MVYGNAFTSKYRDTSPLEHFKPDYDEGLTRLMVFHGDLNAVKSRYGAVTAEQIAATGMDYAALGHVHSFTEVWSKEGTSWAYCGCPEGRGFDETGDKGVLVDVTGKEPAAAILDAIPAGSGQDIYRFRLTGERKDTELDLRALNALVEKKFFDASVMDNTLLEIGLWDRLEEDNLTGLFLRNLRGGRSPDEDQTYDRHLRQPRP